MIIAELIEELQNYNPNLTVVAYTPHGSIRGPITEIKIGQAFENGKSCLFLEFEEYD